MCVEGEGLPGYALRFFLGAPGGKRGCEGVALWARTVWERMPTNSRHFFSPPKPTSSNGAVSGRNTCICMP